MSGCERCGRIVPDNTVDFGISDRPFILAATCNGIEVRYDGASLGFLAAEELWAFLGRSYGERVPVDSAAMGRAWAALAAIDGREWAGASRSEVVRLIVAALRCPS